MLRHVCFHSKHDKNQDIIVFNSFTSVNMSNPARVYATINRTNIVATKQQQRATPEDTNDVEKGMKDRQSAKRMPSSENEIRVCACGELSLPPDRCKVLINVSSRKDKVEDAKNSVSRRVDYIIQTLHNHHLKVRFSSTTVLFCIFMILL